MCCPNDEPFNSVRIGLVNIWLVSSELFHKSWHPLLREKCSKRTSFLFFFRGFSTATIFLIGYQKQSDPKVPLWIPSLHFWLHGMTWCSRWSPSTVGDQGTPHGWGRTGCQCSWDARTAPSNHSVPWWSCSGWSTCAGQECRWRTRSFALENSYPQKTQSEQTKNKRIHARTMPTFKQT